MSKSRGEKGSGVGRSEGSESRDEGLSVRKDCGEESRGWRKCNRGMGEKVERGVCRCRMVSAGYGDYVQQVCSGSNPD